MIDSKNTRREIFNNLELIKKILPTKRQADLISIVSRHGHATSGIIAIELDISIPSASSQLKALYEKGWLARSDVGRDSGGSEYLYQTIFYLPQHFFEGDKI